MPEISIVVPVYNVESYVPQCIDSIRSQTLRDIEIICVVDGSTDRSEAIVKLYAQVEPRMHVIVQENRGLSAARNAAIEAATGKYVMFVDSDDMLVGNACQTVLDIFQKTNAEVVTFGAWCYPRFETTPWYEDNLTPNDVFYESFSTDILFKEKSHPFTWRTAVSTDLLRRTGLRYDETIVLGEDQVFHFALYPKAHGVAFSSKRLYEYRVSREGSLMSTSFTNELDRLLDHIRICNRICENWKADGLMQEHGTELAEWVSDFLFLYCLRMPDAERAQLVPGLHDLFAKHFSEQAIDGIAANNPIKPVCKALINPSWNGVFPETLRVAFLKSLSSNAPIANANDPETETRSAFEKRLRTALPMSAAGLEYRLENLGHRIEELNWDQQARDQRDRDLATERFNWAIKEAGACARSLALLQCELLAKGYNPIML